MSKFRKGTGFLCLLLSFLYFTSYVCRLNYSASMAEIIASGTITKTQGGLIGTVLFFAYGAGQIISGALSDKFSPDKIIFSGLVITVICNVLMPIFGNPVVMAVIWGVNGFAQALFWPPIISIMSENFNEPEYASATMYISMASHAATILIYIAVSICIQLFNWQGAFYMAASWAAAFTAVWVLGYSSYKRKYRALNPVTVKKSPEANEKKKGFASDFLCIGTVCMLISVTLQGYLKDGIQSWLPTFFTEVFDFSSSAAILSNAVLPIFTILIVALATNLFSNHFKHEIKEALFFFSTAFVLISAMLFLKDISAVFTLISAALVTGSMHGINLMLISFLPRRYLSEGRVATVSGICNACSYLGSAISSYGIAYIAENAGWNATIISWGIIAALGALLCIVNLKFKPKHF